MGNWKKIIHVPSSLPSKEGQYSMFIGRWQPLHIGHKEMFMRVINEGGKVLICIRDVTPDEKNPWTSNEVMENITKELSEFVKNEQIKVMIIPDICSVEFGRGVGYNIIEHVPPPEIGDISATKIREELKINNIL